MEMSSSEGKFAQVVGSGSEDEAQAWLNAVADLAARDGSPATDFMTGSVFAPEVPTDDAVVGLELSVLGDGEFLGEMRYVGHDLLECVRGDGFHRTISGHIGWAGAQL